MSMKHIASLSSQSYIKGIDEECIQPNAGEVRVDKVFRVDTTEPCKFLADGTKEMRSLTEVPLSEDGTWTLYPGIFEIIYKFDEIYIAPGEAGWVVGRSSFMRCGVMLHSTLYDSGFKSDKASGLLEVMGPGPLVLGHNTRIGQFILMDSETLNLYDGDWGMGADGNVKSMQDSRYG